MDHPLLTELEASALLAHAAVMETMPRLAKNVQVSEERILDMIEGKLPLPRRVVRYLGLRREIRYYQTT